MSAAISGSMLRDLLLCERRLELDLHGDPARRDATSAFLAMLWRYGLAHEVAILGELEDRAVDLRGMERAERTAGTLAAIAGRAPVILGAVIAHGDLIGMPDLLRLTDRGYVASDVKSGAATEGPNVAYRKEYLVQVAHYAAILAAEGLGRGDVAAVIDATGAETTYDLTRQVGRCGHDGIGLHASLLAQARSIRDGQAETRAAASARCGMCHWKSTCRSELRQADDLTRIAGLGRSLRGPIEDVATSVAALARIDPYQAPPIRGVGADRLARFVRRARLLAVPDAGPVVLEPLGLPTAGAEIDFDVEADPLRGIVYLHGFWHDDGDGGGEFVHFFAETPDEDGEREAFARAMAHFRAHADGQWYHYSAYERTAYRGLQRRHPDVCSAEEVEAIFDPARCTDLYSTVGRATDWPLGSYGIKAIARACGFDWEDSDPGGANSIEWYDRWVETRNAALRRRIVAYNRDDVRASARVRQALRELEATGAIAGFRRDAA